MELRDAVCVVTGASSGIGAATVPVLAERGATVVAVARRRERLDELAGAHRGPGAVVAIDADLSDPAVPRQVVEQVRASHGRLDVVVNNAGRTLHKNAADTTLEEIEAVLALNFHASVRLTMAVLPELLERRRGSIVNVTSVAGTVPNAKEAAYGASKAALARWSHGLAVDLRGTGVHVGNMAPGPIESEIWEDVPTEDHPAKRWPARDVAVAIREMIETEQVQRTVPPVFALPGMLYPAAGRPLRWLLAKAGGS